MPGKRGRKKKQQTTELSDSSGQTQASAEVDHAFASSDNPKRTFRGLKKLTGKQWLIIGAAVILLAGGVFAAWYLGQKNATDQQNQAFKTLMSNVKNLRNEGKDGLARVQLLQFNKKYPDQTENQRLQIATVLGAIFMTSGDYKEGAAWQKVALDNNPDPTWGDYMALGQAYALNQDKAPALKYLRLALDTLKTGDPKASGGAFGKFIQSEIDKLEQEKQ